MDHIDSHLCLSLMCTYLNHPFRKEQGQWVTVTGGHVLSCIRSRAAMFPTTHMSSCEEHVNTHHYSYYISDVLVKRIPVSDNLFPVTTNVLYLLNWFPL